MPIRMITTHTGEDLEQGVQTCIAAMEINMVVPLKFVNWPMLRPGYINPGTPSLKIACFSMFIALY